MTHGDTKDCEREEMTTMNLVIFGKDGSVMGYSVFKFEILDSEKEIFWEHIGGRKEEWPKEKVRKVLVDGVTIWESWGDVE